jgi:hypothetical protein
MNIIKKSIKDQERRTRKHLSNFKTLNELIASPKNNKILQPYTEKCRHRLYPPIETLSMFVTQALSSDSSCQNVVDKSALNDEVRSISTGAYCRARKRLDTTMIRQLCNNLATTNKQQIPPKYRWNNRSVYLVDGTTLVMSDTKANQAKYPQTSALKKGLGFPICRVVGIMSLSCASLIDAEISPYQGKGASEQSLLRTLLHQFNRGDIVLADAFYSTYFLIEHMISHGIDIVFVQHGSRSRTTDFTSGSQLGKKDHIITFTKPKSKPDWMTEEAYIAASDTLQIREFKAAGKTLISTMLCPKKYSKKSLGDLYKQRWHIELDLRNIKTTMGLEMLSCKRHVMNHHSDYKKGLKQSFTLL